MDRFINTFLTADQNIFLRALHLSLLTTIARTALKYFRISFSILKTYPAFFKNFINTYLTTDQKSNLRAHKNTYIYTHRKAILGEIIPFLDILQKNRKTCLHEDALRRPG